VLLKLFPIAAGEKYPFVEGYVRYRDAAELVIWSASLELECILWTRPKRLRLLRLITSITGSVASHVLDTSIHMWFGTINLVRPVLLLWSTASAPLSLVHVLVSPLASSVFGLWTPGLIFLELSLHQVISLFNLLKNALALSGSEFGRRPFGDHCVVHLHSSKTGFRM